METQISTQAAQACASLAVGVSLGLFYDLLRILRQRLHSDIVTFVLDTLFWVGAGLGLFSLGLGPGGGELRLFMIAFSVLGAVLYFYSLSALTMLVLNLTADLLCKIADTARRPFAFAVAFVVNKMKKISKIFKKSFQKCTNWFIILVRGVFDRVFGSVIAIGNASAVRIHTRNADERSESYGEDQKGKVYYMDRDSGGGNLRGDLAGFAQVSDVGNGTQTRRARRGSRDAFTKKR